MPEMTTSPGYGPLSAGRPTYPSTNPLGPS